MKKKFDMITTENIICDISAYKLTETELQCPKNMPEISRLINVSGRNIITLLAAKEEKVTVEGKTCFTVSYMDLEGGCRSFESAAAFECDIKANGADETCALRLTCDIKVEEMRVLGSGAVFVRAVNIFKGMVKKTCEYSPEISSECEEDEVFVKNLDICAPKRVCTKSGLFSKREDIRLPQNLPSVKKILDICGYATVKNINVESMRISAEGDMRVDVLYESTDRNAPIMHYAFAIPFGGITDDEEIRADDKACVYPSIMDIDAASFEGSEDMITVEISYKLKSDIYRSSAITLPCDVYTKRTQTEIKSESIKTLGLKEQLYAKSILRSPVSLPDAAPDISRVLYTYSVAEITSAVCENGFVEIKGEVWAKVCYSCINGSIFTACLSVPFTKEIASSSSLKGHIAECICNVEYFEVEGSGRDADVKFSLETQIVIFSSSSADIVLSAKDKEKLPCRQKGILVYTSAADACVWDICKRFHISPESLCDMNPKASCGSVKKGEKLLIFP